MIYELRTYTAFPGKFNALLERFRDHTLAAFARNGIINVGYWTDRDADNQLTYLIAFKDAARHRMGILQRRSGLGGNP
jgi:NIPSNAP